MVIEIATRVVGWKYDYRARVWTNWDRRPWLSGVLTLAYVRELLNAHNLVSTYPPDKLVAFQKTGQKHPPSVEKFRTADGSWNSLSDPKEGAANTRFLRNVDLSAAQAETGTRLETPNAREISLELLRRPDDDNGQPKVEVVPFLNLLAASWIQFMIHDWVSHSDTQPGAFIRVDLLEKGPHAIATFRPSWRSARRRSTRRAAVRRVGSKSPPLRVSSTRSPTGGTAHRSTAAIR